MLQPDPSHPVGERQQHVVVVVVPRAVELVRLDHQGSVQLNLLG